MAMNQSVPVKRGGQFEPPGLRVSETPFSSVGNFIEAFKLFFIETKCLKEA